MKEALDLTVLLYALGLAAVCVTAAVSGRPRSRVVPFGLVVLFIGILGQAAFDVVALLTGKHPDELVVHLGYLITSVAIVPVTVATVRPDPGRWSSACLALGCAVLAVVSLRLDQTLGTA